MGVVTCTQCGRKYPHGMWDGTSTGLCPQCRMLELQEEQNRLLRERNDREQEQIEQEKAHQRYIDNLPECLYCGEKFEPGRFYEYCSKRCLVEDLGDVWQEYLALHEGEETCRNQERFIIGHPGYREHLFSEKENHKIFDKIMNIRKGNGNYSLKHYRYIQNLYDKIQANLEVLKKCCAEEDVLKTAEGQYFIRQVFSDEDIANINMALKADYKLDKTGLPFEDYVSFMHAAYEPIIPAIKNYDKVSNLLKRYADAYSAITSCLDKNIKKGNWLILLILEWSICVGFCCLLNILFTDSHAKYSDYFLILPLNLKICALGAALAMYSIYLKDCKNARKMYYKYLWSALKVDSKKVKDFITHEKVPDPNILNYFDDSAIEKYTKKLNKIASPIAGILSWPSNNEENQNTIMGKAMRRLWVKLFILFFLVFAIAVILFSILSKFRIAPIWITAMFMTLMIDRILTKK